MQNETGYTNDHIAASFHASHYHRLVGEETPRSKVLTARVLRDQRPDGSWWLNMPARDRHATFDAVFTLEHDGDEGGLGHAPGSTSDADANYFQIGVLVMAGLLPPVDPLPADHELLS